MQLQPNVLSLSEKSGNRIALAMPMHGEPQSKTFMSVVALMADAKNNGIELALFHQQSSMITGARNDLVRRIIGWDPSHILWVDSDMQFPQDALRRLLLRGKDIVGATYLKRVPPHETLGQMLDPMHRSNPNGLHEARYMPGGFMLVKTDVYKALPYPWYFETYRPPGDPVTSFLRHFSDSFHKPLPEAIVRAVRDSNIFSQWIYEESEAYHDLNGAFSFMSEDYNFCRKARDYGFEIFCDKDLTYEIGHIGQQIFLPEPSEVARAAA